MRYCSIITCTGSYYGLGYCSKHYGRFKRYGDPNKIKLIKNPNRGCKNHNCHGKHKAKGLCTKHYNKEKGKKYYQKNKERLYIKNKIYKMEYYQKNKDKIKKQNKMWVSQNPEKQLTYIEKHLVKYGKILNMNSIEFSYALQVWSKTIKKLDNKMCKNCNSTKNLHAHHLFPKALFPEIALDLDNGITLCKPCHVIIHGFDLYS